MSEFKLFDPNDPEKPISAKKPDGWMEVITDDGKKIEYDTKMCCHCGGHFNFVAGSGRRRGWCTLCNNMTCGSPNCHDHFPFEKRMDMVEKGLIPDLMSSQDQILPQHKKIILP